MLNQRARHCIFLHQAQSIRQRYSATLLGDGRVLVADGSTSAYSYPTMESNGICEIYDPFTRKWSFTGPLNIPRSHHQATLLSDGKVIISWVKRGVEIH